MFRYGPKKTRIQAQMPHESLRGLTPSDIYFQFKRHKKHYEL